MVQNPYVNSTLSSTLEQSSVLGGTSPSESLQPTPNDTQIQVAGRFDPFNFIKNFIGSTVVINEIVKTSLEEKKAANQAQKNFEDSFFSSNPPTAQGDPGFYGATSSGDSSNGPGSIDIWAEIPDDPPMQKDDWFLNSKKYKMHGVPPQHSYSATAAAAGAFSEGSDEGMGGLGSDSGSGGGFGFGLPVVLDLGGAGIEIIPLGQSRAPGRPAVVTR